MYTQGSTTITPGNMLYLFQKGIPEEFYKTLCNQFGVSLYIIEKTKSDEYSNCVPHVLDQLKDYLLSIDGLDKVGIFRLSPDCGEAKTVKALLNNAQILTVENCTAETASFLIKSFFKELPEAFFNEEHFKDFLNMLRIDGIHFNPENLETAINLIKKDFTKKQNKITYNTMCWLADLATIVADKQKVNKMSVKNFSAVLTPNLIKIQTDGPGAGMDSNLMWNLDEFFVKFVEYRNSDK